MNKIAAKAMEFEKTPVRYRTNTTKLVEKSVFEPLTTWSIIAGGSLELSSRFLRASLKFYKKYDTEIYAFGVFILIAIDIWVKLK